MGLDFRLYFQEGKIWTKVKFVCLGVISGTTKPILFDNKEYKINKYKYSREILP